MRISDEKPINVFKRCCFIAAIALVGHLLTGPASAAPIAYAQQKLAGVDAHVVTVDLTDPDTTFDRLTPQPNEKSFYAMVDRAGAAALLQVTRKGFGMGRAPAAPGLGTGLYLLGGNRCSISTSRWDPPPDWAHCWLGIEGGVRLLRDGQVWLHPEVDPALKGPEAEPRSAIGVSRNGKRLYIVTFAAPVTFNQEAAALKGVGAWQAVSVNGGAERALAVEGELVAEPQASSIGPVLAIYDAQHPTPRSLLLSLLDFGREGLKALKKGETLKYAGLNFESVGHEPVVSVAQDTLLFGARSYGAIFAAWRKPREQFVLNFDARVVDEGWTCYFDGDTKEDNLIGLSLECRLVEPRGLFLRQDGKVIGSVRTGVPLDHDWHRYHCQLEANTVNVFGADTQKPLITAKREKIGRGLGFSGRGEFRRFTLKE